ncbi:MAG: hypothetical protein H7196_03680 [candidate division SR1 bacterium]|nr:hypothetical protein [candidate division SR1 bacterium]
MIKKINSFMDKSFWKHVHKTVQKFDNYHPLARIIIGTGLVVLGVIGIILPVMPGWIFLIPGIILVFPFTKKWFGKN